MRLISSISFTDEKIQEFQQLCPGVEIVQVKGFTEPDLEAEVILTYGWDVKKDTLDLFPNLRWIQSMSAGVDMLPLDTIAEKKIMLSNVQGAHQIQMSEHVIWSMLMVLRQGATFVHQQDKKSFSAKPKVDEMYGKTVCIVGAGTIGREIALKCSVFGMKVLGVSREGKQDKAFAQTYKVEDIDQALGQSDIAVIVLPLTAQTKGFINKDFINMMKDGAILINVARGPVADEEALIEALQNGKLKAAALDVFVKEPLPEESPLWEMENVFITPHIGGRTIQASERMWEVFKENLQKYPNFTNMSGIIDLKEGY